MPCTYMCIIMINGTTVIEFRWNKKKKKKENMDNLENNLLHVSHTLCIIISYFLRYNLHFAYSLPRHYYKSCCFHIESESCIFVMYRVNAEHPGQFLYTPTTVGVISHSAVALCI